MVVRVLTVVTVVTVVKVVTVVTVLNKNLFKKIQTKKSQNKLKCSKKTQTPIVIKLKNSNGSEHQKLNL